MARERYRQEYLPSGADKPYEVVNKIGEGIDDARGILWLLSLLLPLSLLLRRR